MSSNQPIPTPYGGCRFRSRLEARWAVFFDALAIPWHYEFEGWMTVGAPYLPDFWLPHQNCWYEVKGTSPIEGYRDRLQELAAKTKRRTILAVGDIPRPDTYRIEIHRTEVDHPPFYMEAFFPDGSWDAPYAWCRCDGCGATDVQFSGRSERNCGCSEGDRGDGAFHPDVLSAYVTARSARFEHGERG